MARHDAAKPVPAKKSTADPAVTAPAGPPKRPEGRKAPGWLLRRFSPLTQKRLHSFGAIRRARVSLVVLVALVLVSLGAELVVNSRALAVWYQGRLYLPTYGRVIRGEEFGLGYKYETDYRELRNRLHQDGTGWVLLPPVPWNPYEQDYLEGSYPPYGPSLERSHLLGTDTIGRDILARLLYGFRTAILYAFAITFAVFLTGTLIGSLMGYWGGRFDLLFQRFIEIWENVPVLYIIMILASIFKPDLLLFIGINLLFSWTGPTWGVRAMTYRERERDYIKAARTYGASTGRIIRVHLVPNILVILLTALPFAISGGISGLTALDYLGFGLPPPHPSWGELLSLGIQHLRKAPWILASILSAMVGVLVMITFVGEGLREAFDPRRHTVYK